MQLLFVALSWVAQQEEPKNLGIGALLLAGEAHVVLVPPRRGQQPPRGPRKVKRPHHQGRRVHTAEELNARPFQPRIFHWIDFNSSLAK